MKEKLSVFLCQQGYMPTMTSLPEFMVHFLPSNGNVEVLVTIDYQKEIYLTAEVYSTIKENFARSFKEKGFTNVHILTLVLCGDLGKIDEVFGSDDFTWYIDINEKRIFIPDGHVENFYGIKEKIEEFLPNIDDYVEKLESKQKKKNINIKQIPFVNMAIISINVIIFILCAFMPELLYNKGAFSFKLIQDTNEYYRFITSVFLHADTDHLLSNMLVLFFLGNSLESNLGHLRYVILYFLSAIGGNILSSIYEINFGSMIMSVGASGAIFGVMAAVFVLIIVRGGRWNSISFSRMLLMIIYSLYSGFVSENVNNAGHIGGFVVGLAIMALFYIIERLQKKKEVSHEN